MKLPLSKRLESCAQLVSPGSRVVDVGADHGYLGIYLLCSGIACSVIASELREMPLARAKRNAERFGVAGQMRFVLCDGLRGIAPSQVDTVICAGMGGDTIAGILEAAPWVRDPRVALILQPQSSGNDLRRYLGQNGFCIEAERLSQDGRFLYCALRARYGGGTPLSPGRQYCSDAMLADGGPLLEDYLIRVIRALERTVEGLRGAQERSRLDYYEAALEELKEMRKAL